MHIDTIVVGLYEVNCYIVSDEKTKDAFIIDPGFEADKIRKVIDAKFLKPQFIVNTHGHADHIGCNHVFGLPIYIHKDDADFLSDPIKNLSAYHGVNYISPQASRLLDDGDIVSCGGLHIEVLHTPGHTPGSICLKIDSALFSGDTLFRGSIGRTDFPSSDPKKIIHSIEKHIMPLDDTVMIYPGHGVDSILGWEKSNNIYLTSRMP